MHDQILYNVLEQENLHGSVACVTNTFANGEPMLKALGITAGEFNFFAEIYIKKAIADKISVAALDSDKVIGNIISEDFLTEPPAGIENVTPKMYPVFELLTALDEIYKSKNPVQKGEYYHMFMGSVYKEYSGKKVTISMLNKAHEIARNNGYKYVIVEATGSISQYIFEHFNGYTEVARISYNDFEYNGEKVFANINDCEYCKLFVYKL